MWVVDVAAAWLRRCRPHMHRPTGSHAQGRLCRAGTERRPQVSTQVSRSALQGEVPPWRRQPHAGPQGTLATGIRTCAELWHSPRPLHHTTAGPGTQQLLGTACTAQLPRHRTGPRTTASQQQRGRRGTRSRRQLRVWGMLGADLLQQQVWHAALLAAWRCGWPESSAAACWLHHCAGCVWD